MHKSLPTRAAVLLLLAMLSHLCWSQDIALENNAALWDRFYIGVGGFYPTTSTTLRLDRPDGGLGTSLDFERALGLDEKKFVFAASGRWRWGETKRWRLEAEYFNLNRDGSKVIDRQIDWGNNVYPINSQVDASLDFRDTRVSVGYSFFKTVDKELGIALGAHVAHYDAEINSARISQQGGRVTAPLPVLSFYGQFALTPKWALNVRLDRFSLSYGDYDGNIMSLGLDVQCEIFRHFIALLGYRNFFMKLDMNTDKWHGRIDQTYQGPLFQLQGTF